MSWFDRKFAFESRAYTMLTSNVRRLIYALNSPCDCYLLALIFFSAQHDDHHLAEVTGLKCKGDEA